MSIDERFIKALHVETLREQDLHAEREPHVIFQTSTIDALLDGAYDGDVTFSQLRDHGDLGLGTFEACDGEMIAVGGEFFRASVDGSVSPVPDSARTPFAVVTFFEPGIRTTVGKPLDQDGLMALIDSRLRASAACHALRVDGRFDYVRARSVPRQRKPYPPLAEVANSSTFLCSSTSRHARRFPVSRLCAGDQRRRLPPALRQRRSDMWRPRPRLSPPKRSRGDRPLLGAPRRAPVGRRCCGAGRDGGEA